jgi:hypothetical protein
MKIIDHNGRLFGKISVVDLLVIAIVAVMGLALFLKNTTKEQTSTTTSNRPITYQVMLYGARNYVAQAVEVGDMLYDNERSSGGSIGEIVEIEQFPGEKICEFVDGTVGMAPVEDGTNLLLTVEGAGIISDGRILINRVYDLGVNSART